MIKAKKGLLIALFAALMIFAFGATSAFAASPAGHEYNPGVTLDADGAPWVDADFKDLKVIVAPTCEDEGVGQIECIKDLNDEKCGYVQTVGINPLGHQNVNRVRVTFDTIMDYFKYTAEEKAAWHAANPDKCEGYVYKCADCGDYLYKSGSAYYSMTYFDPSDFEDVQKHNAPNGTVKCAASFTCTVCGLAGATNDEFNATTSAAEHADPANVTVEDVHKHANADDTEYVNVEKHSCKLCKQTWYDNPVATGKAIEAFSHTAGAAEVTKVATCSEQGESVKKCTECGFVMEVNKIEKLPHQYSTVTMTGTALNYALGVTTYNEDLTYTADVCTICSEIDTSTIKTAGFVPAGSASLTIAAVTDANCEQGTWLTATYKYNDNETTAIISDKEVEGAISGGGVIEVAGKYYVEYPDASGAMQKAEVPYVKALGHKFGTLTKVAEATCTAAGIEAKVCENCGKVDHNTVQGVDKALGHTPVVITEDAICGEGGYTHSVCAVCGEELDKNGKAPGEPGCTYEFEWDKTKPVVAYGTECTYEWKEITPATPFAEGVKAQVCSVCGDIVWTNKQVIEKTTIAAPKVKAKKKKAVVTVVAIDGAASYQILVNGQVKVDNAKVGKNVVKKLKGGKKVKVQIQATDANGVTAVSAVKKVKIKK